ncbi:MAG TPA: type VI secretion system baseplate subunit TssE [Thermoanaerobaculia bacterium]|nr:type VI secretion system baseplate subunit TssE [Thermoanaerobaculia bacterium]
MTAENSGALAPVPLFDRLSDPRDGAPPPRGLDRAGLRESLCRELARIFNTRCGLTVARYLAEELTVTEYGIPDLSAFSPANQGDHRRLEAVVTRAVQAFEPRLSEVRVTVEAESGRERALWLSIAAALDSGAFRELIEFPVAFDVKRGMATLR